MNLAGRVVAAQIVVTATASVAGLIINGVVAYSALLGGLTAVLPGIYAALRFQGFSTDRVRSGVAGVRRWASWAEPDSDR